MNNFDPLAVIILAAGLGKRMNSSSAKVMAEADGSPIIDYVVEAALALSPDRIVVVTGYQREALEAHISHRFSSEAASAKISYAFQAEQKGTGDAVKSAVPSLADFTGSVMILCGDIPLITSRTLETLRSLHHKESATVTLLSVKTAQPAQYGRIMRGQSAAVQSIKEFKDCSDEERLINEINSGIYIVDSAFLPGAVGQLKNNNAQREFYFTDIVSQAAQEGQKISCLVHFDLTEVQGVNNRVELGETSSVLKRRRATALIEAGVVIRDIATVDIAASARIEPGAIIGANTVIAGTSIVEKGAEIEGFSILSDTTVKSGAVVHQFVHAHKAVIGSGSHVGPFARLREGTILEGENKVGNFVETKNTVLAPRAKASHLTYLGDAHVGERANIGAGTITCNYDGVKKSKTVIGADAFIGSNSALVAPVEIGTGATIGAGSTITKNVDAGALALTRSEQKSVPDWSTKKRSKK